LTRDIDNGPIVAILSVRPSVCLSRFRIVWKWLNAPSYILQHMVVQVQSFQFFNAKRACEIPTGSPPTGALNTAGLYKFRDFRPISGYMRNDTRYGHSYRRTVIGNSMRSIEPRHFQ